MTVRDRAGEVDGDVPALVQVAQEAAQCRGEILCMGTGEPPGMTHDEPVGIPGNQRLKGHGPRTESLREKRVHDGEILADRQRTQAALVDEEVLVGAFDPRDRVVAVGVFGSLGDPPLVAQMAQ